MPSRAQPEGNNSAAELYLRSGAAAYGISAEQFSRILDEIRQKYIPLALPDQQAEFVAALRLEELALARACAAGNERAWEDFVQRYRQKLHAMAFHITREAVQAADLADSLFAELYGVSAHSTTRSS